MPRNGAAARERLREAALDLFAEQGYEATTTTQIAARAGLTERTYFRHFPDKREVLFSGEDELIAVFRDVTGTAPSDAPPLATAHRALLATVPLFVAGRPVARRRASIIETNAALRERAHAKTAALVEGLAAALVEHGAPAATAAFTARIALAVLARAIADWTGRSGRDLERGIDDAFAELRAMG